MTNKKINIIYIASNGRSGSTLLDLLLGAHPNIWSTGEFQNLYWELKNSKQPCGCGKHISQCDFWKPIILDHSSLLESGIIHHFRETGGGGKVVRFGEFPYIMRKSWGNLNRQKTLENYGKKNAEVLNDVLQRAKVYKGGQVNWLVDASKDLYRLLWLRQSGYFNLKVIHLMKIPQAFVFSMTKNDRGWLRFKRTFRMTGRWIVENFLIHQAVRNHFSPSNVIKLGYEDLADAPHQTLEQLMHWLELPYDPSVVDQFRNTQHGISGNEMRYRKDPVKLDIKWRYLLPPFYQKSIRIMTAMVEKNWHVPQKDNR
ncbi:hypothetical protein QUF72_02875 [Desulfobacterales bacterium HSG2]|nr:hypothetical protein [Desulfobacterales bacterium HSG2]